MAFPKAVTKPVDAALAVAVEKFVQHVRDLVDTYYKRQLPNLVAAGLVPTHEADFMSDKWVRIMVCETYNDGVNTPTHKPRSVYGFVCLQDYETKTLGKLKAGDIHKAATWKAPAKHKRGSVLDEATWTCAQPHGIIYLK